MRVLRDVNFFANATSQIFECVIDGQEEDHVPRTYYRDVSTCNMRPVSMQCVDHLMYVLRHSRLVSYFVGSEALNDMPVLDGQTSSIAVPSRLRQQHEMVLSAECNE